MNAPQPSLPRGTGLGGRAAQVFLVAVLGVACVGFVVGIRGGAPSPELDVDDRPVVPVEDWGDVAAAMTYRELRTIARGPNQNWAGGAVELGRLAPQSAIQPAVSPTEQLARKLASLELRGARRAYNGAPPVIPHRVKPMSSAECLACHAEGLRIGVRAADRLPHPALTNCQQCHASEADAILPPPEPVRNSFAGLAAPTSGERAWAGAPPTIPHSTFMRENCLSCHGPGGKPGMETSHPERANCLQCHGPSASLDQAITADRLPFSRGGGSP